MPPDRRERGLVHHNRVCRRPGWLSDGQDTKDCWTTIDDVVDEDVVRRSAPVALEVCAAQRNKVASYRRATGCDDKPIGILGVRCRAGGANHVSSLNSVAVFL